MKLFEEYKGIVKVTNDFLRAVREYEAPFKTAQEKEKLEKELADIELKEQMEKYDL
jgi:hypothetical protein